MKCGEVSHRIQDLCVGGLRGDHKRGRISYYLSNSCRPTTLVEHLIIFYLQAFHCFPRAALGSCVVFKGSFQYGR